MFNGYEEDNSCCYFHPKEVVVGVCHLCLKERLLILAAKQGNHHHHDNHLPSSRHKDKSVKKLSPINLPKIFALGSLFNRLEFRHWKQSDKLSDVSISPEEESFISIKFEDNGAALWEKGNATVSKASLEKQCNKPCNNQNHHHTKKEAKQDNIKDMAKETMRVIEHAKPRGAVLRLRNRIGHLFQVIKPKRSTNKGNACHVEPKFDGVKVMGKG